MILIVVLTSRVNIDTKTGCFRKMYLLSNRTQIGLNRYCTYYLKSRLDFQGDRYQHCYVPLMQYKSSRFIKCKSFPSEIPLFLGVKR